MFVKIKNALCEIIFPIHCVGCGTEGEWFCESCSQKILLNAKQFCPVCWRESSGGKICASCESPLSGLRVAASYQRNPELARAVKTLKYKFSEPLAENLGALLSRAVSSKNYSNERVITFVPLHKKRRRWRGFNQAELLARVTAKNLNLPLESLLIRKKNTPPQAKLNRADRLRNLEGAFMIREGCSVVDKTILLIDDVASTSSTLSECAKILKQSGAREVWGLVLARG
ncbi:MAG: ComF family protein [Candidatus Peribacteraceae bacterium]|nr:ComF family protein [Candidatus Peribacteraceae bacterium]